MRGMHVLDKTASIDAKLLYACACRVVLYNQKTGAKMQAEELTGF